MLLLLRLIADLQSFLYMQVLQWFAPFLFPGTQADHLLSSSKKDYWSKITRIKSLFIWGQCMLQVENPGSTSMSKAQMNSTDAYESLKGDGRKTDTALWVAENKTEFTWKWVTKGKRKWDFYAFKQTIWFIPAYCMFSSFQVLEPHETAKIRHDRQGLSAQHAPLAGWHETFWFCSNVTKYIVGWKSYRWRPWNSCNLLPLSLSLSLSQSWANCIFIRKKLFTDCKLASEEVGATVHWTYRFNYILLWKLPMQETKEILRTRCKQGSHQGIQKLSKLVCTVAQVFSWNTCSFCILCLKLCTSGRTVAHFTQNLYEDVDTR